MHECGPEGHHQLGCCDVSLTDSNAYGGIKHNNQQFKVFIYNPYSYVLFAKNYGHFVPASHVMHFFTFLLLPCMRSMPLAVILIPQYCLNKARTKYIVS
jgi:hypothetical protein